jgi:hypothetical protein|tara:strand:- start:1271 stop:1384 length:114 start_codon:yes stop_codon:yes gene_type:complete
MRWVWGGVGLALAALAYLKLIRPVARLDLPEAELGAA